MAVVVAMGMPPTSPLSAATATATGTGGGSESNAISTTTISKELGYVAERPPRCVVHSNFGSQSNSNSDVLPPRAKLQ